MNDLVTPQLLTLLIIPLIPGLILTYVNTVLHVKRTHVAE